MFGSDNISADLPAPRDDEPASLRQDIVDELRDHLDCAFVRELHTPHSRGCISADQTTQDAACQRVLARFGNPATIARRLWWDSMQEKIMAQRFTAIMAGIAAAACVAVGVLMWQLLQNSRAAQAATLAEMRNFNARLLAQLAERPTVKSTGAANWAPVRIKMVSAADETPVAGGKVNLYGGPFGSGTDSSVSESGKSNAEGIVELHSVPYGRYTLIVQAPGDELRASKPVLVGPDRNEPIVVRVPATPGTITPRFEFGSPPSAAGLAFLVDVWDQPLQVDGLKWEWLRSPGHILVDDTRVASVARRFASPAGQEGFDRERFDLVADVELLVTPLHVRDLNVVHILERAQDDEGEHIEVLSLASFRFESGGEAPATGGADGTYRVTLPDSFWRQLERAQVRLGIKEVPDGMELVKVLSSVAPQRTGLEPGRWIDLILNYQTSNTMNANTVRLLEQVEIFNVQSDDTTLDLNGNPREWIYTVYLTDEQAELVELAQRTHGADFVLRTSRAPTDVAETVAIDPQLRDRLIQESAGEAPPPNGSGA